MASTISRVGLNTELSAPCVPKKIHIHAEMWEWNASFDCCRIFLRDGLHLTSPSEFVSSEFLKGKVGRFTANQRSFYNRSGKGLVLCGETFYMFGVMHGRGEV